MKLYIFSFTSCIFSFLAIKMHSFARCFYPKQHALHSRHWISSCILWKSNPWSCCCKHQFNCLSNRNTCIHWNTFHYCQSVIYTEKNGVGFTLKLFWLKNNTNNNYYGMSSRHFSPKQLCVHALHSYSMFFPVHALNPCMTFIYSQTL